MERGVTEELVELLKKKNVDFISLNKLYEEKKFKDLNLKCSAKTIEKALKPYLGDVLDIRKGSPSKCLTFKLPDEVLLFRIVEKSQGKKPRVTGMPFNKTKYLELINKLLEQDMVRVQLNTKYEPLFYAAKTTPVTPIAPASLVAEEDFRAAFRKLERGLIFVKIYELRLALGWPRNDFDSMLRKLRDEGKIGLHVADPVVMTENEVKDCFLDESGIRMGTITLQ